MIILKIEDILKQQGITEKELADRLGISLQSVNAVIRCREIPSMKRLERYAHALSVNTEDLYEEL